MQLLRGTAALLNQRWLRRKETRQRRDVRLENFTGRPVLSDQPRVVVTNGGYFRRKLLLLFTALVNDAFLDVSLRRRLRGVVGHAVRRPQFPHGSVVGVSAEIHQLHVVPFWEKTTKKPDFYSRMSAMLLFRSSEMSCKLQKDDSVLPRLKQESLGHTRIFLFSLLKLDAVARTECTKIHTWCDQNIENQLAQILPRPRSAAMVHAGGQTQPFFWAFLSLKT